MNRRLVIMLIVLAAAAAIWAAFRFTSGDWHGADEKIERLATDKGRPPARPWIDLPGDSALFAFLLAGAVGGFVAGYFFRGLFDPRLRAKAPGKAGVNATRQPRSDSRD